ncbi:10670_t:CDS:2 [Acaulospora morrowiae]|uniref:10670_t:CDS:1 n=1 Tax=Acaulospora morrowiae TaxID=94023 RepID=A0A9N9HQP6_9GLOM|nr:10670_t:CDS:2 [Acaulospora morrowiae]
MTEASFRTKDQKYPYSDFQAFCEANPLPIRTSTFATERSLVPLGYPHSKDPPERSRRPCSDFKSDHAEQGIIYYTSPPLASSVAPNLGFNFTAQVAVIDTTPSVIPAHLSVNNGLCHQGEMEKEVKQESNCNVSTSIRPKSSKKRSFLENRIACLKRNKARYKTRRRREKRLAMIMQKK